MELHAYCKLTFASRNALSKSSAVRLRSVAGEIGSEIIARSIIRGSYYGILTILCIYYLPIIFFLLCKVSLCWNIPSYQSTAPFVMAILCVLPVIVNRIITVTDTASKMASHLSLHFCVPLCWCSICSLVMNLHKPNHFNENLIQTTTPAFCTIFVFFPCFLVHNAGPILCSGKWWN